MVIYTRLYHLPFQIDDEDYGVVSQYTWRLHNKTHGAPETSIPTNRCEPTPSGGWRVVRRCIFLHILLWGEAPKGFEWDHIDRDPTNNHRSNLRVVTREINMRNRNPIVTNTSGIIGVSWHSRDRVWVAEIHVGGGVYKHIGNFKVLEEAVAARKAAELTYWGDER